MKDVKFNFNINEKRIYNTEEIIEDFSEYFGIEFSEMKEYFKNYHAIPKETLYNCIITNMDKIVDVKSDLVHDLMEKWRQEYESLKRYLIIISENAKLYLLSLEYMANLKDIRDQYEEVEVLIEKLNIYHLGKAVTGESVNTIFLNLSSLFLLFQNTLEQIEKFETEHIQLLDSLMVKHIEEGTQAFRSAPVKQNTHLKLTLQNNQKYSK